MKVFRGKLESACLSIHVSVCPSVYKILVSVKALVGVLSHLVTALVFLTMFFVAFVEDNATLNSIRYFENHVLYFVQN